MTLPWPGGRALLLLARRDQLMGMVAPTYYTADMVRAMPDDGIRYETVHGELAGDACPSTLASGGRGKVVRRVTAIPRRALSSHLINAVAPTVEIHVRRITTPKSATRLSVATSDDSGC